MNKTPIAIVAAGLIVAGGIFLKPGGETGVPPVSAGVLLPAAFGAFGAEMLANGTIDGAKLAYATEFDNRQLAVSEENAHRLLNVLWALGLSHKNEILEEGEMADPRYGSPARFASTAGWTLARGDAMEHYSRHRYFELTPEEQERVDRVSQTVFRPCCRNSAHFPDCNHGMAMLGFLELMASQGADEAIMKAAADTLNSYWFPELRGAPQGSCRA